MGAANSTQGASVPRLNNLIDQFAAGMSVFKNNDLNEVRRFIEALPDNPKINKRELIEVIAQTDKAMFSSSSSSSSDSTRDPINSDSELYNSLARTNEAKMQPLQSRFSESGVGDSKLQKKLGTIFAPFTRLQTDAMFYRYKYIQMNVIFILIISQYQDIFEYAISGVAAEYEVQVQKQMEILERFIQLTQSLSGDGPDRDKIDRLASRTLEGITNSQEAAKSTIDKLKTGTVKELVDVLLRTQQMTTGELQEALKKNQEAASKE